MLPETPERSTTLYTKCHGRWHMQATAYCRAPKLLLPPKFPPLSRRRGTILTNAEPDKEGIQKKEPTTAESIWPSVMHRPHSPSYEAHDIHPAYLNEVRNKGSACTLAGSPYGGEARCEPDRQGGCHAYQSSRPDPLLLQLLFQ